MIKSRSQELRDDGARFAPRSPEGLRNEARLGPPRSSPPSPLRRDGARWPQRSVAWISDAARVSLLQRGLRVLGRWAAMVLGLGLVLFVSACGKCSASSQCNPGEHCEFTSGECLAGCKSNADCSPTATCDVSSGACRPGPVRPFDAGTSSTSADAGG